MNIEHEIATIHSDIEHLEERISVLEILVMPPSEPPPGPEVPPPQVTPEHITLGGIAIPIFGQPIYNFFLVDPRPVMRGVHMVCRGDNDNRAFPRNCDNLKDLTGEIEWVIDPYCHRTKMGFWEAPVKHIAKKPQCCWAMYFDGKEWKGVYSSGLRAGKQGKIRTPQLVGDGEWLQAEYGHLYIPPMSGVAAQIAWDNPAEGFNKCEPWDRKCPTLTFAGSFECNEYVSVGILQL